MIRPGRFRLLECDIKDSTGCLIETFSKNPDSEQVNKWNSMIIFFWDGSGYLIETFEKISYQDNW